MAALELGGVSAGKCSVVGKSGLLTTSEHV